MTKVVKIAKALNETLNGYEVISSLYDDGFETAEDLDIKQITAIAKMIANLKDGADVSTLKDFKKIISKALGYIKAEEEAEYGKFEGEDDWTEEVQDNGDTFVFFDGEYQYTK